MGSSPSTTAVQSLVVDNHINPTNLKVVPIQSSQVSGKINVPAPPKSEFLIPQLQRVIEKAHADLHSRDPIGKKRYFFQVVNFIFRWLQQTVDDGKTLFQAESLVAKDLQTADKKFPISKIDKIETTIKDLKPIKMPDLMQDIKQLNKQKFTDRVKQRCQKSKQVSYQFNKTMQLILERQGGYKFKAGYKYTGVKAYLRIMTKILDKFLDQIQGSKQVYTDMNHYFWTPCFTYFNKIIDQNLSKLQIDVFDWIRCKVSYKTITDLENAFQRLNAQYGKNIFRVKNRINLPTRDILLNMKFQDQYTQIQLALSYDTSAYEFSHKLYELRREKLGVAFGCFTILLNELGDDQVSTEGVMTTLGYVKKALLREKIEDGFQRLSPEEAQQIIQNIGKMVSGWGEVALETGVIKGDKFGTQRISSSHYGPQISQMMIIKKRSDNQLLNWINWMDQQQ